MFPRDMVCFRNIRVDTLHKGDTVDNDDNDNNNNNVTLTVSTTETFKFGFAIEHRNYSL
jgi:hypothetical protein